MRLSAIGDTCNVVPAVQQLQAAYPLAQITWIIGRTEHALLAALPGIEFIILDKQAGKSGRSALRAQLRERQFDVLLHMHASMRANLISRWIQAPRKIGFDRARARDFHRFFRNEAIAAQHNPHVVDGFLAFVKALGAPVTEPQWKLPLEAAAQTFAAPYLKEKTLIISPCSSDRRRNFRNWSVDNYKRLIDYAISDHNFNVVLTGGNSDLERHYGEQLEQSHPTAVYNLIGQTSLQQLLALLAGADVVVCPDSGPAHMANAVGTPVIGLFATSNRLRTGPYLSQKWLVDRYPDALKKYLHKSIDDVRWGQRVRAPEAMDLISFADVKEKFDALTRHIEAAR